MVNKIDKYVVYILASFKHGHLSEGDDNNAAEEVVAYPDVVEDSTGATAVTNINHEISESFIHYTVWQLLL